MIDNQEQKQLLRGWKTTPSRQRQMLMKYLFVLFDFSSKQPRVLMTRSMFILFPFTSHLLPPMLRLQHSLSQPFSAFLFAPPQVSFDPNAVSRDLQTSQIRAFVLLLSWLPYPANQTKIRTEIHLSCFFLLPFATCLFPWQAFPVLFLEPTNLG